MDDSFTLEEIAEIAQKFAPDADELVGAKRFFDCVRKDGDFPDQSNPHYAGLSRCWRWAWKTKGYPIVYTDKRRGRMAYRVSYNLFKGEIPKGMCVMHRCDNKQCTNPDHLELGTNLQNVRDAHERGLVEKGRMRMKKGVQSIYAICKLHNEFSSAEECAKWNGGDDDFFKSERWMRLKRHLDEAFQVLVYIHMPDAMNQDFSTKFTMDRYLDLADKDAVDELLSQDKNKVRILRPGQDTSNLPELRPAAFVRFGQGKTPIHQPLKEYQKSPKVRENYDGTVIEAL